MNGDLARRKYLNAWIRILKLKRNKKWTDECFFQHCFLIHWLFLMQYNSKVLKFNDEHKYFWFKIKIVFHPLWAKRSVTLFERIICWRSSGSSFISSFHQRLNIIHYADWLPEGHCLYKTVYDSAPFLLSWEDISSDWFSNKNKNNYRAEAKRGKYGWIYTLNMYHILQSKYILKGCWYPL